MPSLLAVDLGLRTGLALYERDGRLQWYRSRHFGNMAGLRRAVHDLLRDLPDVERLVLEGGGPLALIWQREAERRQVAVRTVAAEVWRKRLLYPRQQRDGARAKHNAAALARRVVEWSGARKPTSLRDDAAEAILIGLWAVLDAGWLPRLPNGLCQTRSGGFR